MNCRSLAFTVAAFSSLHVASADAQSIYVAPGGVYVGAGPVYVIPATNGAAPCVAPTNGYQCGPPVVVAPPPAVVAPTAVYSSNGAYYGEPNGVYDGEPNGDYYSSPNGAYYGASIRAHRGVPVVAYVPERAPRPIVSVPYRRAVVAHRFKDRNATTGPSSLKRPTREVVFPRPRSRPPAHPEQNISGHLAEAAQIGDGRRRPSGSR